MRYACLIVALSSSVCLANVVGNGGFETGENAPEGWVFWAGTFREGVPPGTGAWDDAVAHTGRRSVRIDGTAHANQTWAQQGIPLRAGYLHRFSAWVRQERCYSWGPDAVVTARDETGQSLEGWTFRGRSGARDWYLLEGYFVAPANATRASIELRLLLLPGTAWFDDVAIVPVGSWDAPVDSVDPVARHEAKLAHLQTVSMQVETPHWDWAPRMKDPPEVLFLLDRIGQREVVELAQRFGFPPRAVAVSVEQHPEYQTGEYYDNLTHAEIDEACRRALDRAWDVLVISGSVWPALEKDTRQQVLEAVRRGGTLVYLGRPRSGNYPDLWHTLGLSEVGDPVRATPVEAGEGLMSCWPRALPPVPVHRCTLEGGRLLASARAQDGTELPLLVRNSCGAGRTLYVAYASEAPTGEVRGPGLTPFLTAGETKDLMFPWHEYLLASVMKWIVWARQPDRWAVRAVTVDVQDGMLTAQVSHDPVGPGAIARWMWRDTAGRVLAHGDAAVPVERTATTVPGPAADQVPGGHVFCDVLFEDAAGTVDWAAACTEERGPRLELWLDKPVYQRGEPVEAGARVDRLSAGENIRWPLTVALTVQDCYGWEWERQKEVLDGTQPDAPEARGARELVFRLSCGKRMQASGGKVRGQMTDAAGRLLAEDACQLVFAADRSWDDWHNHVWSVFGRSGFRAYLHPILADALRATGIDTLLFNVDGEEWRIGASLDFRLIPIGIYGVPSTTAGHGEYAETGDRQYLRRPDCPSTPGQGQTLDTAVSRVAATLGPYGPASYCMSDENNLTYFSSSFDVCMCPDCMRGMRRWLQERWGDLESLNAAWGTNFKDWEQVIPDTFEDARDKACFASWADHRAYMDTVFAAVWDRARSVLRQTDPEGSVSISGTPDPAAYGGYDWFQLVDHLDSLVPYLGSIAAEMQRSYAPDMPRVPWSAGYGSRGPGLSFGVWRAALNGCRGVGAFWQPSLIEPDLTLPSCSRELAAVTRPLRTGLGKLLIAARPAPPQLALYHSMASVRAAYALGLDVEQADQVKGLITGLHCLGVPFALVDGQQVEQGWLTTHRPRALILTMALAMSDQELEQVAAYVRSGGLLLVDGPLALFNHRLERRHALPPELGELLETPTAQFAQTVGDADALLELPPAQLWQERAAGRVLYTDKLAFARYQRGLPYRTCPEIRRDCERCEAWLAQAVSWAGAQPVARAQWENGAPVRDCLWAAWELNPGQLIAVLRHSTAADTRNLRLDLPEAAVVYDLLTGRKIGSAQVQASLGPGDVAVWAVLPRPLDELELQVTSGTLTPGNDCVVDLSLPGAPDPMVVRLELQAPCSEVIPPPPAWLPSDELTGEQENAGLWAPLPGLAQNVLLTRGHGRVTLRLPSNLPAGTRLRVTEVFSHTGTSLPLSGTAQ